MFPEEAQWVRSAIRSRQEDYSAGRHCARLGLQVLGERMVPILTGAGGEPIWPQGVVGSITHCHGYRAAAVTRCRDYASIGIDAELINPMYPSVQRLVAVPAELSAAAVVSGEAAGITLFSVKEAIFKSLFALSRPTLDFRDICVVLEDARRFSAVINLGGAKRCYLSGRHLRLRNLVFAAIVIRQSAPAITR